MTKIRRLLIANRGEIAARIIRSAREMDILTVAVYSDADLGASYVQQADRAVRLPGNSAAETYLRADKIIEAARRTGCDAVHPGYGFLSENADFATACADAGLVFVGPPAQAIAAMGSKIAAKELMAAAGVPVLPGVTVGNDAALQPNLAERTEAEVGYPVLVKAAYGGGGRGMRVVHDVSELLEAVNGARREAKSAFGDGTVFLEHYVESPRHIEVQIFGDEHGNVVHLFERECSIQRRYQKIIEEAPSSAVSESLRAELCDAAVAAAKAIGYVGAGTVEFVMGADGRFFFLEVNTRLQVEHPVTEMITGLDLVRLQLQVAEGERLPDEVSAASINGHAIEVRLYAEDVAAGFLPATGTVRRFDVPQLPGLRVDTGIAAGSEIGLHYDPMLAKVIAHGASRDDARRTLARALNDTRLHGVESNRELLIGILREDEFAAGDIDTGYLTRHAPAQLAASVRDPQLIELHCIAVALAGQAGRREQAAVLGTLPSGWRNVPSAPQRVVLSTDGRDVDVSYRFDGAELRAEVDGQALDSLRLHAARPDRVDLEVDGIRHVIDIDATADVVYVHSGLGCSVVTEVPRFPEPGSNDAPGSLLAPMPGTVVRVAVEPGASVSAGTVIVVLEAMKMEHTLKAPHAGIVSEVHAETGKTVDIGQVLAVIEEQSVIEEQL
ncbi:acetyl/propionyl-CoA carboxylase alpha subunit [Antricoccus suffuscus]|uniref:Biotin-dependent 3-methylcrotonyl-coenzyme A carboxylase alpha1 subunit n=1 Tax=Antricoccus suffuscus TaxID=1629062 RepID=A0A2T1A149_9ACTN|nr:biotin carboxylase N-terminal domain-containing protein [Antricoccus suffuscus]PRZ42058.1 acetyl/propionyl-CoA carboxylase alpha subunit [Antricoccus suffuscus]